MNTRLLIIRHGETDWTRQRRYCGWCDVPLNDAGLSQAQALARRLRVHRVDAVYASDLKRAFEFAQRILPGRQVVVERGLREIDFGVFEGLTHDEIMSRYADVCKCWMDDPADTVIPEGESLSGMACRVRKVRDRVCREHNGSTVALVTHGGPIRVLINDALGNGLERVFEVDPQPASVNCLEHCEGIWRLSDSY